MSQNKNLCLSLVKAESEEEVIQILKKSKLWDDLDNWKFFGGDENNFSVIGNQQSKPESAIVEKFINSVKFDQKSSFFILKLNKLKNFL